MAQEIVPAEFPLPSCMLVWLSKLFPGGTYENQETQIACLPHAHTVLNSDKLPVSENIAQATLLFKISVALWGKGDYDAAKIVAWNFLDLREKALEKDDLDILHNLRNLGSVL